jgi:hypothetical protein
MGKLVNSYDKSSFYGGLMNSMKMSMDINRRYGLDNSYTQKSYNEYKASYDKEVSARDSIMSIVNKAPADSIYSITLSYKIRVKNNTNALVLKELACVYYPNGAEQYIKPKRYFVFFGLLGDVRN